MNAADNYEIATLGGGCFWCLEAVYDELEGVISVESGYAGGSLHNPSYQQVCTGRTGHAEVVQVKFDPSVISYREILEVLFSIHDPTTPNRQGADTGAQYRSLILYHDNGQKQTAEAMIDELAGSGIWDRPIVTQIELLNVFYKAESYHQEYFRKNPDQGYCQAVIAPKLAKFRQKFTKRLKA